MQNKEICYEINLASGNGFIELESLRPVLDALEKQLPDHGKFRINIGIVNINTNHLKQTQDISLP